MPRRRKSNKGTKKTSLQKARHGGGHPHEGSVSAFTAEEWDSGGHGHQSPPKIDSDGVPIYGRQWYSAKALEAKLRSLGLEPGKTPVPDRLPERNRPVPVIKRQIRKAKVQKQMLTPSAISPTVAGVRPVPPPLEAACAEFQHAMGEWVAFAKQVIDEFRRAGVLTTNCKWRLFAWCYTRDPKGAEMAQKIWRFAIGALPSKEHATTYGLS